MGIDISPFSNVDIIVIIMSNKVGVVVVVAAVLIDVAHLQGMDQFVNDGDNG